jgi:hypothetical protein
VEPEGELPHDLEAADRELADMEQGLFNTRAVPEPLVGCKKYAVIYQNVTSLRFFDALTVRTASAFQGRSLPCSAMHLHWCKVQLAPT